MLEIRPRVRRGDPFIYALQCKPARIGGGKPWGCDARIRALVLDDREVSVNERIVDPALGAGRSGGCLTGAEQLVPMLGDGMHHGYVRIDVSLIPPDKLPALTRGVFKLAPGTQMPPLNWRDVQAGVQEKAIVEAALTTVQLRLPIELEITPADQPALKPIADPGLRAAVERSIAVTAVHAGRGRGLAVDIECKAPPVDLSFRVGARDGATYWPIGTMTCRTGERKSMTLRANYTPSDPIERDAVDVIFTPEVSPGAGTTNVFSYWSSEVVVKDVAVTRSAGR
jgi:hypothetical protein